MLSKRTNILFEEDTWLQLTELADKKQTSVGDLVRKAVQLQYLQQENTQKARIQRKRKEALRKMKEVRERMSGKYIALDEFFEMRDRGKK
ncbi:MAG: hypothetical protein COY80_01725 [Candidatus Pacebacteria bacterium CG_4_10_14_0_8_um_filter_42_14]|nr:MAG: hypothetical protein COY80_01725 [Candidatus Pacebacteria bacterium CG_4_10_14_0_8_um_filter_42_14]